MKFHVYRVVELFEVEVDGDDSGVASADAVAKVKRGEVPATKPAVDLIAFPAAARVKIDSRELLGKLLRATDQKRREAAEALGLSMDGDPTGVPEWLSLILRRAVERGQVASLLRLL